MGCASLRDGARSSDSCLLSPPWRPAALVAKLRCRGMGSTGKPPISARNCAPRRMTSVRSATGTVHARSVPRDAASVLVGSASVLALMGCSGRDSAMRMGSMPTNPPTMTLTADFENPPSSGSSLMIPWTVIWSYISRKMGMARLPKTFRLSCNGSRTGRCPAARKCPWTPNLRSALSSPMLGKRCKVRLYESSSNSRKNSTTPASFQG